MFAGEGKRIFGLDSYPGVSALDSLLCLAQVYLKSLVYGVQIRTVISIGYLDCAGIYLEKNDSPTRVNAGDEEIVDEG